MMQESKIGTKMTTETAESQYVSVKTSVWWDIENCQVPKDLDAHRIAQNISSALVNMNYCGPVSISAYGDTNSIPKHILHTLNSTGIALNHVPAGVKDASDKKILVDMLFWAVDNPAPANFMLISGDRDFSNALHQLRMRRYNILLAQPQKASTVLIHAAKTVWMWTSLANGGSPLDQAETTKLAANVTPFTSDISTIHPNQYSISSRQFMDSNSDTSNRQDSIPSGQSMDSNSETRRNYDNKSKIKYVPKSSNFQSNNHSHQQQNTQMKQFKKSPISEPNPLSLPVTSNPQNQYTYPPRTPPFPVQQPYHNPETSWNNGNSFPNHPNGVRTPYGSNIFCPYRPENMHPSSCNGFRPMHPRNPTGNGFRPMQPGSQVLRYPTPSQPTVPDISNLSVSQSSSQSQIRPTYNPQVRQEFRPKMEPQHTSSLNGPPSKCYVPKTGSGQVSHSTSTSSTSSSTSSLSAVVTESGSNNNGTWETQDCPPPSEYVQGLIGVILHALIILKTEKLTPTESNIRNCIQYGDPEHRGTDVRKALDSAMEQNMITVQNVGKLKLYIGRNEALWNCVNPLGTNQYPKATWNRIQQFLTSSSGQALIMKTQCSYEAAQVLKKECLKELTLGDILQILNIISSTKKWITCHHTGWQPITISLATTKTKDETGNKTVWQPITITLAAAATNDEASIKTVA